MVLHYLATSPCPSASWTSLFPRQLHFHKSKRFLHGRLWSRSQYCLRSTGDHVCWYVPVLPVSNGAHCSDAALPWNILRCLGVCDAIWEGESKAEHEECFFQAISLFLETLSVVSEVLSSRLVNNTVFVMWLQVGIWAHRGSEPLLSIPLRCCL